jgi:hypothetical protein
MEGDGVKDGRFWVMGQLPTDDCQFPIFATHEAFRRYHHLQ